MIMYYIIPSFILRLGLILIFAPKDAPEMMVGYVFSGKQGR